MRTISFLLFSAIGFLLFYTDLLYLLGLSLDSELYSHIMLIPIVSGYLIYSNRKEILAQTGYGVRWGAAIIASSIAIYLFTIYLPLDINRNDQLTVITLSAILFWTGGFLFFYGHKAAKAASFPLLFLFLMVPLPEAIMDGLISMLQSGSAEVTNTIFKMLGLPIIRNGYIFQLPGLNIEIAKECSGIRSTLALFITSVLAGHLYLKTGWKKVFLSSVILPITIFKNGLRIVSLTLLGYYVDERALYGTVHTRGGIPFFLMGLIVLGLILWVLKKTEKPDNKKLPAANK